MYRLGAFGARAADERAGIIAAAAGNATRFKKKADAMWEPADYFPLLGRNVTKEEQARQATRNVRSWFKYWQHN